MVYLGMDVSNKSFVLHVIDERRRVVWRGEVGPTPSGLKRAMRTIGAQAKVVVFEAGNQMKWIARELGRMTSGGSWRSRIGACDSDVPAA
jgi:hypothetical protein